MRFTALIACLAILTIGTFPQFSKANEPAEQTEPYSPSYRRSSKLSKLELGNRSLPAAPTKTEKKRLTEISEFYKQRVFDPLWTENGAVSKPAITITRIIGKAEEHALEPSDYAVSALTAGSRIPLITCRLRVLRCSFPYPWLLSPSI